jgi:hypothetical protein
VFRILDGDSHGALGGGERCAGWGEKTVVIRFSINGRFLAAEGDLSMNLELSINYRRHQPNR